MTGSYSASNSLSLVNEPGKVVPPREHAGKVLPAGHDEDLKDSFSILPADRRNDPMMFILDDSVSERRKSLCVSSLAVSFVELGPAFINASVRDFGIDVQPERRFPRFKLMRRKERRCPSNGCFMNSPESARIQSHAASRYEWE